MALTTQQQETIRIAGPKADAYRTQFEKQNALSEQTATANTKLSPQSQVVGPNGATTTSYGVPSGGSMAGFAGAGGSGGGGSAASAYADQQAREAEQRDRLAELKAKAGYDTAARSQTAGIDSAEATKSLGEREAANDRARAAMFAQYNTLAGGSGAGGGTPTGGMAASEQAARDAAFARAKEQSGQVAQSALEGLRNSMSRRGITGGGYSEMRGAEALAPAADQLQDFTREGLIQDYNRAGEIGDRDAAAQLTREQMANQKQQSLLGLLNSSGKLY